MPPQIGTALSSLGTGAEGLASSVGTGAENLYNALPSPSALWSGSGTPAPATGPGTLTTSTPGLTSYTAPPSPTPPVAPPTTADQFAAANFPSTPGATATSPATPAAAAPSLRTSIGGPLSAISQAVELYQRYQQQQNLQNPSWVASQIAKLQVPLSGKLKNEVGRGVQAQAQEAGLGGAPGLFRTAMAQALAPYQLQEQQNAESDFLGSQGLADQAYPLGGGMSDFGNYLSGLYPQGNYPQATS